MLRQSLQRLLDDPRRELRVLALERLGELPPDAQLRQRVEWIANQESDPLIRGHARLLATQWSIRSDIADEPFALDGAGQDQPVLRRFPPLAPALLPSSSATPLPSPKPIRFDSAISPIAFTATHEIGDSPQRRAEPFPFTPVTPFWLSQPGTVSDEALPADVQRPYQPAYGVRLSSFDPPIQQPMLEPPVLNRPLLAAPDSNVLEPLPDGGLLRYPVDAPLGYTGPSGVLPSEYQTDSHFVPVEDRWRIGMPHWDRYDRGFPVGDDYPFKQGSLWDPYNLNVLKGDYPIIGQHTFLTLTAVNFMFQEYRQTPTPTTPFESTRDPFQEPFFGDPNQYFYTNYVKLAVDVIHGNEAFKPADWRLRIEPVFNVNYLKVEELGVTRPDVRKGTTRGRTDWALEEWFFETKLADLSPDYDFASVRAGSQLFVSDFRGFIFKDVNRGVRLFGTRLANRDQFNLVWFDQTEKETNSQLNTFDDRHQNTVIANYFRQDFIFPGYTSQLSFHYNLDKPSTKFDENNFLVRPDPAGVFREHEVEAYYLGWAGDGHIGRVNITHQLYLALGEDSRNPIAGCSQSIEAQMAAVELSYDRDWIRFRGSYFFASGDNNPNDRRAGGFDTILDDPIFAGGEFSYWQRQQIKLFGVNLVQQKSLVPNLRSSKIQGQSNFVNPGLHILNLGMDFELTPKLRAIANANYLRFDTVEVLRTFTFQGDIGRDIGADLSLGFEWRPYLNDNVIVVFGSAVLIPGRGLRDLFGTEVPAEITQITGRHRTEIPQFQQHFMELALTY